jgi:glycosyltransferase involved in cell wall biosynthesis/SAM-dependent methyltransferase/uncharacterized protein YbaR (Trm112 family)
MVALPDEPGNAAERLRAAGVDVFELPLHRLRAVPDPRTQIRYLSSLKDDVSRLEALIRQQDVDFVQIGGLVNPPGAFAARRAGIPVLWQIVDSRPPAALRRSMGLVVARMADAILFDGRSLVDLHFRKPPQVPWFTYFPPVATNEFRPSDSHREEGRRALGIPLDAHVVGTVANLNPQKGLELFIEAAGRIIARAPDTWFVIVGSSYQTHQRYEERLREAARDSPARDRILFLGDRPDVERVYPVFDLKLITSLPRSEGTTTTALEAMSCGVPVVATDVAAVHEAVVDGVVGRLVPPRDAAALVDAVVELLEDTSTRAGMARAARQLAEERFDVEAYAAIYVQALGAARVHHETRRGIGTSPGTIDSRAGGGGQFDLLTLLRCPACHGELEELDSGLACRACAARYPVEDGIPILLAGAEGDAVKNEQIGFYDEDVDEEFEIERPRSNARLYGWLMEQKFARSVKGIEHLLPDATVLSVCGGSGMDAEFLARTGANVIVSDISIGAMKRARERAARHGVTLTPVVADVEQLPFEPRSMDVVYVHDGLHHLVDPKIGLREMARVARKAVSVTEPARAALTTLAVRVHLSVSVEEAGNVVARMDPQDVADELRAKGYEVVGMRRYAMFYRHEPGWAMRTLSRRGVLAIARGGWRGGNAILARWGNKFALAAIRRD